MIRVTKIIEYLLRIPIKDTQGILYNFKVFFKSELAMNDYHKNAKWYYEQKAKQKTYMCSINQSINQLLRHTTLTILTPEIGLNWATSIWRKWFLTPL